MDHPIFHGVFDLAVPKNKLQTPNVWQGSRSQEDGVTWERHRRKDGGWEECSEMHVRAILDEKGRIMVIAVHNCDNGDGWERQMSAASGRIRIVGPSIETTDGTATNGPRWFYRARWLE